MKTATLIIAYFCKYTNIFCAAVMIYALFVRPTVYVGLELASNVFFIWYANTLIKRLNEEVNEQA